MLICIYSARSALTPPILIVCSLIRACYGISVALTLPITAFEVPSSGTYWYHSHLSTQYLDGLRGVIVVYVCGSHFSEVPLNSA